MIAILATRNAAITKKHYATRASSTSSTPLNNINEADQKRLWEKVVPPATRTQLPITGDAVFFYAGSTSRHNYEGTDLSFLAVYSMSYSPNCEGETDKPTQSLDWEAEAAILEATICISRNLPSTAPAPPARTVVLTGKISSTTHAGITLSLSSIEKILANLGRKKTSQLPIRLSSDNRIGTSC